jgi:DNA-binding response OmpR family regulator
MPKILIVEDNYMLADMVEDTLLHNGYEVCGIARTVAEGLDLCGLHKPDLALIDLRLADGELGTEMAAQLRPFGNLGILYVSGNTSEVKLTSADGHASLSKPYLSTDLLRAIWHVTDLVKMGHSSPPYPPGFRFLA